MFEGTSEAGNPFSRRQSFLADQLHWGGHFDEVVRRVFEPPHPPRVVVELERFNQVVGEQRVPDTVQASQLVVGRAKVSARQ